MRNRANIAHFKSLFSFQVWNFKYHDIVEEKQLFFEGLTGGSCLFAAEKFMGNVKDNNIVVSIFTAIEIFYVQFRLEKFVAKIIKNLLKHEEKFKKMLL